MSRLITRRRIFTDPWENSTKYIFKIVSDEMHTSQIFLFPDFNVLSWKSWRILRRRWSRFYPLRGSDRVPFLFSFDPYFAILWVFSSHSRKPQRKKKRKKGWKVMKWNYRRDEAAITDLNANSARGRHLSG